MAHHFLTPGESTFILSDAEDVASLGERLQAAATTGDVVEVKWVLGDQIEGPRTLWVNPRALGWWTIVEHGQDDPE